MVEKLESKMKDPLKKVEINFSEDKSTRELKVFE